MKVTTENGHTHDLSRLAIQELQQAKTANVADAIFDRFADLVPPCDRCGVWLAIDSVTL